MGGEGRRVEPTLRDQLQEARGRVCVDESHRDRDVAEPQPLEVERCRVAVDTDVCDPPPGRISSVQSSNVSGTPTASIATSTPSPSVSSITFASASSVPLLIVDVGAEASACSRRLSARSIAMISPGSEASRS